MTTIELTSITGLTYPYTVYVCDYFGNNCALLAVINTTVPPNTTFVLPPQFNSAPIVGIKVITSDGCEKFETVVCT